MTKLIITLLLCINADNPSINSKACEPSAPQTVAVASGFIAPFKSHREQFKVENYGLYMITTISDMDLIATIYGPKSKKQITMNDDDGKHLNPLIMRHLKKGYYEVKIESFSAKRLTQTGEILIIIARIEE